MATKLSLWRWSALDLKGNSHMGISFATGKIDIMTRLCNQALFPVRIQRARAYESKSRHMDHRIHFLQQLSALLKAGISLPDALVLLNQQHASPLWQAVLQQMILRLNEGEAFSYIVQSWPELFPPLVVAMSRTGEMTGKLDLCFEHLSVQQEQQRALQRTVSKALRYPLVTLCMALAVTLGMLLFVLPTFADIYQAFNTPLPAVTRILMSVSDWLNQQIYILTFTAASVFILVVGPGRNIWRRFTQYLLQHAPVMSRLYEALIRSQIFMMLSLTQQSGVNILHGLQLVEDTLPKASRWRQVMAQLSVDVTQGITLGEAMRQHSCFTALCYQLVSTGEQSGALDTMLDKLASWHRENTQLQASQLTQLMEPLLMVITGLITGLLVLAMYLPIFGLGEAMGAG
ncbi:protein transport protein HofC [Mangrovibacter yixingensis]|uniref:protein transport protein HofC n=1 Tax=Mangrovibacter yixingensis TaxID=1529639 RepID=UPI001CFE648C|nr:protein transport protein HofC [Mangrovibacter yixingensis]